MTQDDIMTQNDITGCNLILIVQFDDVKVAGDGLLNNSSGLGVLPVGMLLTVIYH